MASYNPEDCERNAEVVRLPRPADALGAALRETFRPVAMPADLVRLVRQLDG